MSARAYRSAFGDSATALLPLAPMSRDYTAFRVPRAGFEPIRKRAPGFSAVFRGANCARLAPRRPAVQLHATLSGSNGSSPPNSQRE